MKVYLTKEDLARCSDFAQSVISTNADCYAKRNQTDLQKIIQDITIGKMAELGAAQLLSSRGLMHSEPDFAVYSKENKSFGADLIGWKEKGNMTSTIWNFHVKSMERNTAIRFGLSWSFQAKDSLVRSPHSNDYLVLCEYEQSVAEDGYLVDIKAAVKAMDVTDYWKDPKLEKLRGIKKVLYWKELEDTVKKL